MAVLSIQSHVVYGHAGNSAAVFPFQRLGREVWAVNTVEFSNHTGYGAWRGQVLPVELVDELVLGLAERGVLDQCEAVISGYMGSAGVGQAVMGAVRKVRAGKPRTLYCCDPVMGDLGRGFYVHPDIPGIFKNEVIPLADIVTPNQFELEALTGIPAASAGDALNAMAALHKAGPKTVLLTSYRGAGVSRGELGMIASEGGKAYLVKTPELIFEGGDSMAGSGDLTTAVFLSRYLETGDIKRSLELTAASVFGIMEATHRAGSRELLIVGAQEELVSPSRRFEARRL